MFVWNRSFKFVFIGKLFFVVDTVADLCWCASVIKFSDIPYKNLSLHMNLFNTTNNDETFGPRPDYVIVVPGINGR